MFKRILELTKIGVSDAPVFHYYLERHAHLDGEHHGPMALKLLDDLCANEPEKENEVILQVQSSLNARITVVGWCYFGNRKFSFTFPLGQFDFYGEFISSCGRDYLMVLFSGALGGDIHGSTQ